MKISAEKTKLMTNRANGIQRETKLKGHKLGTVTSFKYLGAVVSDDGSKPEILSRTWRQTEKEADRRRDGKTISKGGQEWTLPAQVGQLKTGQDGKGLLQIHLWCPDDLPRLWDRKE